MNRWSRLRGVNILSCAESLTKHCEPVVSASVFGNSHSSRGACFSLFQHRFTYRCYPGNSFSYLSVIFRIGREALTSFNKCIFRCVFAQPCVTFVSSRFTFFFLRSTFRSILKKITVLWSVVKSGRSYFRLFSFQSVTFIIHYLAYTYTLLGIPKPSVPKRICLNKNMLLC